MTIMWAITCIICIILLVSIVFYAWIKITSASRRNNYKNSAFKEFELARENIDNNSFEDHARGMECFLELGEWKLNDIGLTNQQIDEMKKKNAKVLVIKYIEQIRNDRWSDNNGHLLSLIDQCMYYGKLSLEEIGVNPDEMKDFEKDANLLSVLGKYEKYEELRDNSEITQDEVDALKRLLKDRKESEGKDPSITISDPALLGPDPDLAGWGSEG